MMSRSTRRLEKLRCLDSDAEKPVRDLMQSCSYESVQLCSHQKSDLHRPRSSRVANVAGQRVDAADVAGQNLARARQAQWGNHADRLGPRTCEVIGRLALALSV